MSNNESKGNNYSDGNHCSDGNNWSNGNNYSYGNNWSNGNNYSYGNHCSNGNNYSDGNNYSCGNNCSCGNNRSNGNNYSDGNNYSYFLHNCRGTHKSIFCKDKEGIAYEILNKKYDEEKYKEFKDKVLEVLNGWLPYTTNYLEMKEQGWHKKHSSNNTYVEEYIEDDESPFLKQYHDAWSRLNKYKQQKLFKLIKETNWLHEEAINVFKEITGLKEDNICCEGNFEYCPECGTKLTMRKKQ